MVSSGLSVCYFGKTKIYRVFTNYMSSLNEEQERFDAKTPEEVIEIIAKLKESNGDFKVKASAF